MTTMFKSWSTFWQLLALLLATLTFGFELVGRFCVFAAPAWTLAQALKAGRFSFVFSKHDLRQSNNPLGFWLSAFICFSLASAGLWLFIRNLSA